MPIMWRAQLSVGNDVIDDDHRTMIDIINEYDRALDTKDVHQVNDVFDRLKAYTHEHFEREEKLQLAVHFDHALSHKEEHEELIRRLDSIHRIFMEKNHTSLEYMRTLLRDWFIHHIIESDLQMVPFLKGGRH